MSKNDELERGTHCVDRFFLTSDTTLLFGGPPGLQEKGLWNGACRNEGGSEMLTSEQVL
jgi:hypothetical protein